MLEILIRKTHKYQSRKSHDMHLKIMTFKI